MKRIFKLLGKLNNKGLSLVEILVTIAIIGIVIVPILSSFTLAAKLNKRADRLQNATVLAQSISEEYKAMTKEQLDDMYGEPVEETDAEGNKTGRLIYKNIGGEGGKAYFEGAAGEKFYVTVTLDPNEYKHVTGINDYKIPSMSDLYGGGLHGPIVLKSDIIRNDNEIYGVSALNTSKDNAKYIVKETTVTLSCRDEITNNYYFMSCYLDIKYTYNGMTYSPERKLIESYTLNLDDPDDRKIPIVYICYNTFDIYSTNMILGKTDICKAKDKFNFVYQYEGETDKEQDIKVYLAQQVTNHSDTTLGYTSALDKSNISVTSAPKLSFYTNVPNWEGNNLTSSDKTIDSLYKMTVTISNDEDGSDVVTTFDSTKEN